MGHSQPPDPHAHSEESVQEPLEDSGAPYSSGRVRLLGLPRPGGSCPIEGGRLAHALHRHLRGEYILSAAKAFASVAPDFRWSAPDALLEEWLRALRGIGPWSAPFILLRALGRYQGLPKNGRGMMRAASLVYGAGKDPDAARCGKNRQRVRPVAGVLGPLPAGAGAKQGDTTKFVNSQPPEGGEHLHPRLGAGPIASHSPEPTSGNSPVVPATPSPASMAHRGVPPPHC